MVPESARELSSSGTFFLHRPSGSLSGLFFFFFFFFFENYVLIIFLFYIFSPFGSLK
jgi:hypothetical protein